MQNMARVVEKDRNALIVFGSLAQTLAELAESGEVRQWLYAQAALCQQSISCPVAGEASREAASDAASERRQLN